MNILALDPATHCGFAHSCGLSGVWDLSVRRDESSGMRLIRLRGKLDEIKRTVGVDILVYEANRYSGAGKRGNAQVVQSEIQGVIKVWGEDNKVDYRAYSSKEVKKHATGNGNAGKDAMKDAAVTRFKRVIEDDNECDALWILDFAKKEFDSGDGTGLQQPAL